MSASNSLAALCMKDESSPSPTLKKETPFWLSPRQPVPLPSQFGMNLSLSKGEQRFVEKEWMRSRRISKFHHLQFMSLSFNMFLSKHNNGIDHCASQMKKFPKRQTKKAQEYLTLA